MPAQRAHRKKSPPYKKSTGEYPARIVMLDGGASTTLPNPAECDLYIGRILLGTSAVVNVLRENMDPNNVVEAFGHLVLPLTHRRLFARRNDGLVVLEEALHTIYELPPYDLGVDLQPAQAVLQASSVEYAVRLPFVNEVGMTLRREINCARDSIQRSTGGIPNAGGQALVVRAYSASSRQEADLAAGFINEIGVIEAELSMPVICGVEKKI
jgi:hypothetical protein